MRNNPAREALSRAVNRAIASGGAPVYENRPLAAQGYVSYRARTPYGYVMIGATDDDDARREVKRSTEWAQGLERWDGERYVPVD